MADKKRFFDNFLTGLLPIIIAYVVARDQGFETGRARAVSVAETFLLRTEVASDQIEAGVKTMEAVAGSDSCSQISIEEMENIALRSTMLQGFTHLNGTLIDCSSLGASARFDIGPPDLISERGTKIRLHVQFNSDPNEYVVVQERNFAGIVNKNLLFSYIPRDSDISLSLISWSQHKILFGDKFHDESILNNPEFHHQNFRKFGDSFVGIIKSSKYDTGVLFIVPSDYIETTTRSAFRIFLPLGALSAAVIGYLVSHIIKIQKGMPTAIRDGLRRDDFFLEYQPVVDLRSGLWVGAEALIRWRRLGRELVRPDLFIPIAEEFHLIRKITKRVLEIAGDETPAIFRKYPGFHLAVNCSAEDLISPEITAVMTEFYNKCGAGQGGIIVEATERNFVDFKVVSNVVNRLRTQGILTAIDDFGTGHSNLASLISLQVDFIKIDRMFIQAMELDSATSQVASHIVTMGKSLNIRIIAEGVETERQAELLRSQGVELAQGWLFAKAMPIKEFIAGMERNRRSVMA